MDKRVLYVATTFVLLLLALLIKAAHFRQTLHTHHRNLSGVIAWPCESRGSGGSSALC